MPKVDRVTSYQKIRHILSEEIGSGLYAVGARFPTDHELCERFGVSRHSVREALRQLQEQGLLARRPGAGTVVQAQVPQTMFVQSINSMGDLFKRAADTRFEKLSERRVVLRGVLATFLSCKPGERWLQLSGIRWLRHDNVKLSWTDIYVAEPYFGVRDVTAGHDGLISDLICSYFGLEVQELEHEISSVLIDPHHAALIGAQPNSPGLLVVRRYYAEERNLFEVAVSLYPADRYAYKATLARSGSTNVAKQRRSEPVPGL
jgi:DNA-binding GntR family transcriptional regulator